MAHWAEIVNGVVTRVVVGDNNSPDQGYQWLIDNLGGTWVQTSYNTRGGIHYGADGKPDDEPQLNFNYAGVGYLWDGIGFSTSQPYPSWILNKNTYIWEPPISMPNDGNRYTWDESSKSWVGVSDPDERK